MFRYLILSSVITAALSAGTFTVTSPGPLTSTGIGVNIANNDGFDLLRVTFGLAGTTSTVGGQSLVIGGHFSESGPPAGTFSYFQNTASGGGFLNFGYTFTGFNTGESFSFAWDPDIATDPSYGAAVSELDGMTVLLETSGGNVNGVMRIDQRAGNVSATIASPVPEPASLMMMGGGLLGLLGRRLWKRR